MNNYKITSILVPTDFSETANKALDCAIDLAKKNDSKLVLVNVIELANLSTAGEMLSMGIITEQMMAASKEKLKKTATQIKNEHNLKTDWACYSGVIYNNIIRAAHLYNADLILMGTHGTSGIKEWLFGSNAFSVVNNSTIPVLTINLNSSIDKFKQIVFPFNDDLLTLKKVDQVITLAKMLDASILLLGFSKIEAALSKVTLKKKGEELTNLFAGENISSTLTIINGEDYADEILQYANDSNADMITIITTQEHNVDIVFKDRPGKKLVNHSEIPVLSVPVV